MKYRTEVRQRPSLDRVRMNLFTTSRVRRPVARSLKARVSHRILPSRRAYRAAIRISVAAFLGWIVTINAASTIVVSPINIWFVTAISLLGGMAGLRVGFTIGAVEAAVGRHKAKARPWVVRSLMAIIGLVFGMIVGATVAHRMVDIALFWQSDEPIVPTTFPVHAVGLAKAAPFLSIGSEGERDDIGISKRDYDVLKTAAPLRRPWRYCITLKRQANYAAVRVWRPRSRRSGPQTVFPCPSYAQWW